MRMDALAAIWPALHDRANAISVILDLDHEAVLAGGSGSHGFSSGHGTGNNANGNAGSIRGQREMDMTGQGGVLSLGQSAAAGERRMVL